MNKGHEVEVINESQAQVIDAAKQYASGFKASLAHSKGYALLFGTALNQLKEITPHGKFTELATIHFPEYSDRWMRTLMNFADNRKLKTEVTSVLPKGQLLLDLPEDERAELFAHVEKITGEKSIEQIAFEVVKAKAKAKPKAPINAVEKEQGHQKNMEAIGAHCEAALRRYLDLKPADRALVSRATRNSIDALCVRNGRESVALKKFNGGNQ